MARSLRIERSNAVYHIINRGNYRQDLFISEGAHEAFERCLFEACEKCGWILEGHCVMTNHFHLVIRTPQGNLSYGMKWLQATFANRYHRFRKVHGKLFQGRYKSLIIEEDAYLGALQHYVHLNPVRAGMCTLDELKAYRWSSYWYLWQPKKRSGFMNITGALEHAGGLHDNWKVWIANVLKSHSSATNVWIATKLNMGAAQSVSMLTSRLKKEISDRSDPADERFYQNITK